MEINTLLCSDLEMGPQTVVWAKLGDGDYSSSRSPTQRLPPRPMDRVAPGQGPICPVQPWHRAQLQGPALQEFLASPQKPATGPGPQASGCCPQFRRLWSRQLVTSVREPAPWPPAWPGVIGSGAGGQRWGSLGPPHWPGLGPQPGTQGSFRHWELAWERAPGGGCSGRASAPPGPPEEGPPALPSPAHLPRASRQACPSALAGSRHAGLRPGLASCLGTGPAAVSSSSGLSSLRLARLDAPEAFRCKVMAWGRPPSRCLWGGGWTSREAMSQASEAAHRTATPVSAQLTRPSPRPSPAPSS